MDKHLDPGKSSRKRRSIPPGEKVSRLIEQFCYIPEGKFVGRPLKLQDWQKYEISKIYDNPFGTRRAILSFGRKNGKTTFAALLLLVHLCGPRYRANSQLFSAAQSRDQAAIIFNLAAKMVRLNQELYPKFRSHPAAGRFANSLDLEAALDRRHSDSSAHAFNKRYEDF